MTVPLAGRSDRSTMNPIKFECPFCHEINVGDESLLGRRVTCRKCEATLLVPSAAAIGTPPTARLIVAPAPGALPAPKAADQEVDIFNFGPVASAFALQILLGVACLALAIGVLVRGPSYSWPRWIAGLPLSAAGLLWLAVWVRVKSCHYRLTTQRLFVRRGWLARHLDELELYRVKDVLVDQGLLPRLLGYGTVTVLANDDSTPQVDLVRIANPTAAKEMIRTQYRAARQREGVHSTEFMRSP
jgi:membrane protein YdbS with pleckstrin-like domain